MEGTERLLIGVPIWGGVKEMVPHSGFDDELRVLARARIQSGQLTCAEPGGVWAGYGSDLACSLCDHPIGCNEIEYDLEHEIAGVARHYRFHYFCHAAWQVECVRWRTLKGAVP